MNVKLPMTSAKDKTGKPVAGMPNGAVGVIKITVIAPAQLRAARSLLDWSRGELAKESGVSPETIKNIEHGTFSPKEETLRALVEIFARHGVEFVRYESVITIPAGCEPVGHTLALSYAGVVRVTASIPEIREATHD